MCRENCLFTKIQYVSPYFGLLLDSLYANSLYARFVQDLSIAYNEVHLYVRNGVHLFYQHFWWNFTAFPQSQHFTSSFLHIQAALVICGLFICDFAYMRSGNGLFSGTYPLIYSHPWSFYMRIHYMRAYFWSPYLSHITRSNCIFFDIKITTPNWK